MSSDSEINADGSKTQSLEQYLALGFPKEIAISQRARLKAEAKKKKTEAL